MTDWIETLLGGTQEEREDEERPALDGAAEHPVRLPRPETVSGPEQGQEQEQGQEPVTEVRTGGTADAPAAAYRPGAGEPAGTLEPEQPAYRPWGNEPEDSGTPPQALEAAVMEAGGAKPPAWAAGAAPRSGAAAPPGQTGPGRAQTPSPPAAPERAGGQGLAELYRQTARAARPPAPAAAPVQSGSRAPEREGADTPGLTAEELDRAVRRDSRRYDGGMTIF